MSTGPLSEVARHLVLPSGIVSTGWPAVRDKCAELGIQFDPWQDGAGRGILAKRSDGLYAAGIGGVVISIPRQVGKTYLIGALVFALCLLFPGTTVIWTAHRYRTAGETFAAMQAMARRRKIAPHVRKIWLGSGEEEIAFTNSSRILFGARERGFGRGFAGVAVLVFDEAQIMTESVMEDMVPTTNTHPNPLLLFIGTPPRPKDPSEVFVAKRTAALAGEDPDVFYLELSADPDADPMDRTQWAKANPSYPLRTPAASMLRMKKNLPSLDSFLREGLGIWSTKVADPPVIDQETWGLLAGEPPEDGTTAYAVRFSADGKAMALAVAVQPDEDGVPTFVEIVDYASTAVGLSGVADWLAERWRDATAIVLDGKSAAGALATELKTRGVRDNRIVRPTFEDSVTANAGLLQAVLAGTVSHSGQPGLTNSVAGSARQNIGKLGGWGFRPITEDDDTLPVEVTALALWGVTSGKGKRKGKARRGDRGQRRGREAVVM